MRTPNERVAAVVQRAVEIAGSQAELARRLGIKPPHVHRMMKHGHVSAETAVKLEKITQIPRKRFRPDLFA